MIGLMKTTIQISDSLLEEARRIATRDRTTIIALVEEGLRRIIDERRIKAGYRLRRATFKGEGLHSHVADGSWQAIREIIYQGRGE